MVGRSLLWGIGEGGRWQDFSTGRRASVDPRSGRKIEVGKTWKNIMDEWTLVQTSISSQFLPEILDGFRVKKIWLFTNNDEQGERLGSDLQGKFSTIKLPLRLREKLGIVVGKCCSLHQVNWKGQVSHLASVSPNWMLYHRNSQMWHLQRKMKTEKSIHRHTVKCLNYIPVNIMFGNFCN